MKAKGYLAKWYEDQLLADQAQGGLTMTEKASCTPGPWTAENPVGDKVKELRESGWQVWPTTHGHARICSVVDGPWAEANAQLIAACPSLYKAAKLALEALTGEGLNDGEGAVEKLRSAIACAEGQQDA